MKSLIIRFLVVLIAAASSLELLLGQQRPLPKERKKEFVSPPTSRDKPVRSDSVFQDAVHTRILKEIQAGISEGDGELLARHLGAQVYLSLKSSEGGYYSANQALYILQNFFLLHKPISFTFSTYGDIEANPFATGRGTFNAQGMRESLQLYVSLSRQNGRWVISEFNAY